MSQLTNAEHVTALLGWQNGVSLSQQVSTASIHQMVVDKAQLFNN
jgi:hypothetical protein